VFVGTGGVAKSMVIDALMERIEAKLFKVMLRKSMPVEEIFGPLSLKGLENDQFRYITKGRAADANVVFLDEIFKANAVVLNAMLMVINERKFINDGVPHDVGLDSVFGASNELPNEPELAAFRDRFAWVNEVKPVQTDDGFKTVLRGALNRTLGQNVPVTTITIPEIEALQMARTQVTVPDDVLNQIATMKRRAEGEFNLFISARRYISGIEMCRAQAVMNNRTNVITDDLALFQHTLWTDIEDAPKAYEVTLDYAGQVARVTQKLRAAFEPHHNALDKLRGEIPTDGSISQEIAGKIASVQMNLKQVGQQVTKQVEEARSDGRDTGELDSLLAEIDADRTYIRNEILN
jgi:MoxR-like ATPase